jgi:hypothetical protein
VINSVLLQPLPYPDSQRLMLLQGLSGSRHIPVSYTEFLAWKDQKELFEDSAAFTNSGFALTGVGEPEQLRGMSISAALLPMFGVKPAAGRIFLSEEDARTANPVAMITHSFWQSHFHGSQSAVGQKNHAQAAVTGMFWRDGSCCAKTSSGLASLSGISL